MAFILLIHADTVMHSNNESIKTGKANSCAFYMTRLLPGENGDKVNLFNGTEYFMAVTDMELSYQ
jgi:hypothetical protein